MRNELSLDHQAEKLSNVLMLLDLLCSHGFKLKEEICVLEHMEEILIRKIDNKHKRKEAKK